MPLKCKVASFNLGRSVARMQDDVFVLVVPAWIHKFDSVVQNENTPATLVCRSHGDPAPSMTISKIGSPYKFNSSNVRIGFLLLLVNT